MNQWFLLHHWYSMSLLVFKKELQKHIYFKDKELQGQIPSDSKRTSDYDISIATDKIVPDIQCIQKDRVVWRVYVKSTEGRSKRLREGFDIRNRHISVYDTNPYSAGLDSPNERVLTITVKGIPMSVDDGEIVNMLEQFYINFTSELKYEDIRTPRK